jgi:hypothetical protein
MAAIITSEFRKNSRELFINSIKGTNPSDATTDDYYVGLGKTDSWPDTTDSLGNQVTEYSRQFSAPLPVDNDINKTDVLKNLMILVSTKSTEVFNVIPRNNWAFDRIYKTYDPTDPKCFDYETIDGVAYYPCYVTSNDRIYLCLSNKDDNGEIALSSTAIPSGTGSENSFLSYSKPRTIDGASGYIWAYVTSLDEDSKFYTDQFVNYTYPTSETEYTAINNATGGLIYDFKVVNGGGATALPDVTEIIVVGTMRDDNGGIVHAENAVLYKYGETATSNDIYDNFDVLFGDNGIESIRYINDDNKPTWLTEYISASVQVKVNGTISETADIIPFKLPENGLGRYPDNDLPSYYAGIAVDFIGSVDEEAPTGFAVDVRQISLIKNPVRSAAGEGTVVVDDDVGDYTETQAYDALKYIQIANDGSGNPLRKEYLGRDYIIHQESTGAKAWLDYTDSTENRFFYHQNSSPVVNFKKFQESPENAADLTLTSISGFSDGLLYQIESVGQPEYTPETGEVIFYENRKPINRNYNQTDEVKLVIQF